VHDLADLRAALAGQRHRLGAAAAAHGARLAAAGTNPFPADARCRCGVRVAVGCPEAAGAVPGRLAAWLPVLVALAANSPFWAGADTGYASFRAQLRDLPEAGARARARARVPEQARAHEPGRERVVEVDQVVTQVAADLVTDVALEVDDAVLVAALEAGDAAVVDELVAALLARGTGAARQREAHRRGGRLEDVVRLLSDCTVPLAPVGRS
jgi:carboxylate-amine ligase